VGHGSVSERRPSPRSGAAFSAPRSALRSASKGNRLALLRLRKSIGVAQLKAFIPFMEAAVVDVALEGPVKRRSPPEPGRPQFIRPEA